MMSITLLTYQNHTYTRKCNGTAAVAAFLAGRIIYQKREHVFPKPHFEWLINLCKHPNGTEYPTLGAVGVCMLGKWFMYPEVALCAWAKTIYGSYLKVMFARNKFTVMTATIASIVPSLVLTNYQQIHSTVSPLCDVARKKVWAQFIPKQTHTERGRESVHILCVPSWWCWFVYYGLHKLKLITSKLFLCLFNLPCIRFVPWQAL